MNATLTAIRDAILTDDAVLLAMLASNTPFYDPKGDNETSNSIIPAQMINRKMNTPFISIDEGNSTRLGERLFDESFFIRVYNDPNKTVVDINNALDRIKVLLDDTELDVDQLEESKLRLVRIRWESRLPPLLDEAFNLRFREDRYRLLLL